MADTPNAESIAIQLRDFIRLPRPKQQQHSYIEGGFQRQVGQPARPLPNIETRAQIYKRCLGMLTTEEERDALGEVISELERLLIGP